MLEKEPGTNPSHYSIHNLKHSCTPFSNANFLLQKSCGVISENNFTMTGK
jgi:hypothetical protein